MLKPYLRSIPPESQVSITRFEGPNIALYSKNPKFALTELTLHLSSLSRTLKKRFVIKTDPSIRLPEEQTRLTVAKLLPKEVVVSAVFCDDATGEVILEVNKPEAITPELVIEIADGTGWIAHTRLSPHIPSSSISTIHSTLKNSAKERTLFFQQLGNRIFRTPLIITNKNSKSTKLNAEEIQGSYHKDITTAMPEISDAIPQSSMTSKDVMLFCLGGVKQVGRSCFIVMTAESKVMLDCGINPGENPRIGCISPSGLVQFQHR